MKATWNMIEISVPLRVVSEANAHTHWRIRQKRAKDQRAIVRAFCGAKLSNRPKPSSVEMIRIAPREYDSDNIVGALKHVRDQLAAIMGFDDRDKSVDWLCAQQKPEKKGDAPSIRIVVRWDVTNPLADMPSKLSV